MRVLTGVQPSGIAHLGNLFGALFPVIELAHKYESSMVFLADLHALTSVRDSRKLRKDTKNLAIDFLALGLDPERTILFRQSDVPAHCELAWILSTMAPMGLLQRAHSFKDKVAKGIECSVGLFTYPVLMAADILLYSPDIVPVGKDQKQHLEITRDIAEKFNHYFGETFHLPNPLISEQMATVPGTDGQKMSKSYGNTIEIFSGESLLKKQIMGIVTDSTPVEAPKDPDENTIYALYTLFSDSQEKKYFAEKFRKGGMGYGEAKKILFEKVRIFLTPFWERRREIEHQSHIQDILQEGAKKAQKIATKKLQEVKERVGIF
jgi:tryptophanyl-tRNA synthetase